MEMWPNPQCTNKACTERQGEFQKERPVREAAARAEAERLAAQRALASTVELHAENEWNISLVDDEDKEVTERSTSTSSSSQGNLPEGLFHELPDSEVVDKSVLSSETYVQGDEDLDDLQKQLEALNAP